MDHLSALFTHFTPTARVFFTGNLLETSSFAANEGHGHLHVLRAGAVQLITRSGTSTTYDQPCLLLNARPMDHRLQPVQGSGTDLVCAAIDLGSELNNPLLVALPPTLHIEMAALPRLASTLQMLFEEAGQPDSGQQAAMDRLTEYLLVLLLRHVIATGGLDAGILAGLNDERLHKPIKAMHDRPDYPWTLEELAELAALSRARFASRFKDKTGMTPLNYLTHWRIGVACSMLRKGRRIERIAAAVGYGSQSAFTRVFTRHIGIPPQEWLARQRETTDQ